MKCTNSLSLHTVTGFDSSEYDEMSQLISHDILEFSLIPTTYIYIYTHIHIHIYIYIYIHNHIYIYTYIHNHIYTYTQIPLYFQ